MNKNKLTLLIILCVLAIAIVICIFTVKANKDTETNIKEPIVENTELSVDTTEENTAKDFQIDTVTVTLDNLYAEYAEYITSFGIDEGSFNSITWYPI